MLWSFQNFLTSNNNSNTDSLVQIDLNYYFTYLSHLSRFSLSIDSGSKELELRIGSLVNVQVIILLRVRTRKRVVESAPLSNVTLNKEWLSSPHLLFNRLLRVLGLLLWVRWLLSFLVDETVKIIIIVWLQEVTIILIKKVSIGKTLYCVGNWNEWISH